MHVDPSTRDATENVHELRNLAPPHGCVVADNSLFDAMRDVLTQDFLLNASERSSDGGDLRDDIDAVAIFLNHAGETTNLALDAAQALDGRRFGRFAHT